MPQITTSVQNKCFQKVLDSILHRIEDDLGFDFDLD
jgi:hypothetical protein